MSERFNPSSIAIVIVVYYPRWYQGKLRSIKHTDKIRGDIALAFIHQADKRGYRLVIVDGKSSKTFIKIANGRKGQRGVFIRRKAPGYSSARRRGILVASKLSGVKVIVLSEPEKLSILTDCLEKIVQPLLSLESDIVVVKREPSLFKKTYPLYAFDSESEGTIFYNELLRAHGLLRREDEDFDMFFGPRAFENSPKVRSVFLKQFVIDTKNVSIPPHLLFDTEDYSNSLYFPILLALKKQLRVASVTVPFKYPKLQKANEEKGAYEFFLEKRRAQRLSILVQHLHFLSYLENNRGSRISKKNT